jgi:hypothetical protein
LRGSDDPHLSPLPEGEEEKPGAGGYFFFSLWEKIEMRAK